MLLHERLAEEVRLFGKEAPSQVISPDRERLGGEQVAKGRKELRLANQDFAFGTWKGNRGEIAVPIEAGGQLTVRPV